MVKKERMKNTVHLKGIAKTEKTEAQSIIVLSNEVTGEICTMHESVLHTHTAEKMLSHCPLSLSTCAGTVRLVAGEEGRVKWTKEEQWRAHGHFIYMAVLNLTTSSRAPAALQQQDKGLQNI